MFRHSLVLIAMISGAPVAGHSQGTVLEGTWELTRLFRADGQPGAHVLPIDSSTYLRLTLESHPGSWVSGSVYRRFHGDVEKSKLVGGALGSTGRYALSADFDRPLKSEVRTAAWRVGDRLMIGTGFVPEADSAELRAVTPGAPYPTTVTEVVTGQ
jgi:hypothetical protein